LDVGVPKWNVLDMSVVPSAIKNGILAKILGKSKNQAPRYCPPESMTTVAFLPTMRDAFCRGL
jgi:hypothetical protein